MPYVKETHIGQFTTMKSIDCDLLGNHVVVNDFVGKYGDWLFKQPLLLALEKRGFRVISSGLSFPRLSSISHDTKSDHEQAPDWALVFTRRDLVIVDSQFAKQYRTVVEIQRVSRLTERVILWQHGVSTLQKINFRSPHEQERVRSLARFLNLEYQERHINVVKPNGRVVIVSMSVSDRPTRRLDLHFQQIHKSISTLRKLGFTFRVVRNVFEPANLLLDFYRNFDQSEILKTRSFDAACRVVRSGDYFFGADSGLSHFSVQTGKVAFSLFSKKYHGKQPLFQSTFPNHLAYFGDQLFADELLHDLQQLEQRRANVELTQQINRYVKYGKQIDSNPYSNRRKVFALRLAFISQNKAMQRRARDIHTLSGGIFFADQVLNINIKQLRPLSGKLFIDSQACAKRLQQQVGSWSSSRKVSLYAKPCSFFYGTAMRGGSSDLDFPTIFFPRAVRQDARLLSAVKQTLKEYGFSTQLPHQTPVVETDVKTKRSLSPIVINGQLAFSWCIQTDKENLQKYEARIKLKIIVGEMSIPERRSLEAALCRSIDGRRLLREIRDLEQDSAQFAEWAVFIRKLIRATSLLGGFGEKGHVLLSVTKASCSATAAVIGCLMRHGLIYANGARMYLVWDIRRPQHGWFQPITIFAGDTKAFRKEFSNALRSPIFSSSPLNSLKLLADKKLPLVGVLSLLQSPNPLLFMEAYHYIASHKKKFANSIIFSRKEIRTYAREKESNCNNSRDQKLSLLSLATGRPLTLKTEDIRHLTKYNYFVQVFCSGEKIDASRTSFFKVTNNSNVSATDFYNPFYERLIKLLREYYLYTLTTGLPKELLYEKKKEIMFMYYVQGRVLLEGPRTQSMRAARFLQGLDIFQTLINEHRLLETINKIRVKVSPSATTFFLTWLIQCDQSNEKSIIKVA